MVETCLCSQEGSSDGPVKGSRFKQPVGICTEFGSVVYVCDAQTNSVKICTKLKECAQFLKAIAYTKRFLYTTKVHVTLSSQEKKLLAL